VAGKQKKLYEGKVIDLTLEQVTLPNGVPAELEIVHHPGGAAVVAIDAQNKICLLRQYRHAAGGWIWELPAGKLDPGEAPLATAQRELEEEAGLCAQRWESLGKIISSPGVFTEVVHLFLAWGLTQGVKSNEPHELIEIHWLPFAEALARAHAGEIEDAKTLVGLFRAQKIMEGKRA